MKKKLIRLTESDLHRIVRNCVKKILKEDASPVDPQTAEKYKQIFIKTLQEYRSELSKSWLSAKNKDDLADLDIYNGDEGVEFIIEGIPLEVEVTTWAGEEPEVNASWGNEGNVYPVASEVSPYVPHNPIFNGVLSVSTENGEFDIPLDEDMKKAIDEYCTVEKNYADELIGHAEPNYYEPDWGERD